MAVQSTSVTHLVWRWALALGVSLSSASASAAIFVTRWDPEFNSDFSAIVNTNVGWSGEAFITVADNCLTPAGTSVVGTSACSTATLERGALRFYDMAPGGADLLNLSWDKSDPGFDPNIVLVRSNGSEVSGILTLPAIEFEDQSLAGKTVDLDLYFVFNPFSSTAYAGPLLSLSFEQCSGKYGHSWCKEEKFWSSTTPGGEGTPTVTWTRVPEPGSLALIGIALAIGGWTRRRTQAANHA